MLETNVSAYSKDGFLICREYVSPDTLNDLTKWVEKTLRLSPRYEDIEVYREDPLSELSNIRVVENFCDVNPDLYSFAQGLASFIAEFFGEPAVLFKDKINYKCAGGRGYEAHRDGHFWWQNSSGKRMPGWGAYAREFVSAALFLDDATRENGCLEVAKGMHILNSADIDCHPLSIEQVNAMKFTSLPVSAGDMIVFDARLPHRSGVNRTNQPRRALNFTYNQLSEGDHRQRYFKDKATSIAAQGRQKYYR